MAGNSQQENFDNFNDIMTLCQNEDAKIDEGGVPDFDYIQNAIEQYLSLIEQNNEINEEHLEQLKTMRDAINGMSEKLEAKRNELLEEAGEQNEELQNHEKYIKNTSNNSDK
jgi:hypothetical protein